MDSEKSSKVWLYIGIVCLAAVIVMLPIAVWGIPSGTDLPQHFQFAHTYYDSIISGDGFPNWSDRENFGYGGIGIRFYPPLAYYVMAFARILVGNWFDAAWLTFTFWMVLGCLGVYFWARWWMPGKESAIAAICYAVSPYHLGQLYVSFIYADFAGAAILPFCFAFLTRVLERGKKSDILGLATAYAVMVLTHLPTTIIGSLCIIVFSLFLLKKENYLRQIVRVSIGIGIGLAASSFYWVGMVSEMNWLNHATERYSSGHYYFGNRFFPFSLHTIAVDHRTNALLSDVLTTLCLLFLASAIVYLFYRKTEGAEISRVSRIFRLILPLGSFAFLMMTPLSYPLWQFISPLQKIQFPMRWMGVVSICGSIVTAAAIHFLWKGNLLKKRSWSYIAVIFPAIFLISNFIYIWHPSAFVPIERAEFENQLRELPDKQNYEFWWSIWSKPEALEVKEKVNAESRRSSVTNWQAESRSFNVESGTPTVARVATFYYPRWQATVNGAKIEIEKDANGAILIPLPAERAEVKLIFQETMVSRLASLISLIVWCSIFLAFLFIWREKLVYFKAPANYFPEKEFSC